MLGSCHEECTGFLLVLFGFILFWMMFQFHILYINVTQELKKLKIKVQKK